MSGLDTQATRAAELAARSAYGRLVAYLMKSWRDLGAVEDALGEAFAAALTTWPERGVPANPDAWLFSAARNRLRDAARGLAIRNAALTAIEPLQTEEAGSVPAIPDKRLELLYVCAHPALDPDIRTPLMLQVVLGISAGRIASSYLVSPDAMSRRLSRAKLRIRELGTPFERPDGDELRSRSDAVLEAIYAAYGQGWDSLGSADAGRRGLAEEALWLARLVADLDAHNPEALGLVSLLSYCEARTAARLRAGVYVPLAEQDATLWDARLIADAEACLAKAAAIGRFGRFQLEAAIQSAIVQQRLTTADLRRPLLALHAALLEVAPTIGNQLGWIAALAEVEGAPSAREAAAAPAAGTRCTAPALLGLAGTSADPAR